MTKGSQPRLKLLALFHLLVATTGATVPSTTFTSSGISCTSDLIVLSRLSVACADGADSCTFGDDVTVSVNVQINREEKPVDPSSEEAMEQVPTFPPSKNPEGLDEDEAEAQAAYYEQLTEQAAEEYEQAVEEYEEAIAEYEQVTGATEVVLSDGYNELYNGEINLCNYLQLTDGTDAVCPDLGEYTSGDFTFTLPSSGVLTPSTMSVSSADGVTESKYFFLLTATLTLENAGASTCTTSIYIDRLTYDGSESNSYMAASAVGAVVLVGMATALIRRRRRVAKVELSEEEGTTTNFEMMPSSTNVI